VESVFVADAPLQAGAPSPILSQEGSSFSGMVAAFTDQNTEALASAFTAAINWGDGTVSHGLIVANGTGAFAINGSHTYAEDGVYTPVVTIQDSSNSELVKDGFAQVTDAPLVPQSFQPSVISLTVIRSAWCLSSTTTISWGMDRRPPPALLSQRETAILG
jgi:hypothetical protein